MKVLGVIVEYNPFHNGHMHHIKEAKELGEFTHTIGVMSGHFVQRGGPSLFDKWSRAEMAVEAGADLILELPVLFSSQSAEIFAKGSISILDSVNIVDSIVFGSESNSVEDLKKAAYFLSFENDAYKEKLKEKLSGGALFASARQEALLETHGVDLSSTSNDILGIEYIRQLILQKSEIRPLSIKRKGSEYNSESLEGSICSATAIRNQLKSSPDYSSIENFVPLSTYTIINSLSKKNIDAVFDDDFYQLIRYQILKDPSALSEIFDITEGLENSIYKNALVQSSIENLLGSIKSKRYTYTRLRRILFNILLGITKSDMKMIRESVKPDSYCRVLAFNDKGRQLLKEISKNSEAVIINKASVFKPDNQFHQLLFDYDILSTTIYNMIYYNKSSGKNLSRDFTRSPSYKR